VSRPWFPFYVGDYVRDTARLTTEGHGAYLLLMLDYWANGAPPDDDETLASIARLSLENWIKLRQKIEPFFEIAGGRWNHKRIEKELEIAEEKHNKRVNAGKAGGEAKAKSKQSSSNATAKQPALPYQSQSQSQPDIKKEKPSSAPRPGNDDFENLKRIYPKRLGNYKWALAERKFNALVKTGVDSKKILEAARRLEATHRKLGNIGTQFVPMPASWLNSEDFTEIAAMSFIEQPEELNWDAVLVAYKKTGHWSRFAGNDPSSPNCRCPPEILAKYGLLQQSETVQ
jgi:uncharacterized protein YdaU (DUF1376 family)